MKQTGTDYKRLLSLFEDVWDTAARFGDDNTQRHLTTMNKLSELCEFLNIEFDMGEIVSLAGKEVG